MALKAGLLGIGSYLPEKILTNYDLERMVETSDEWIYTRTGIRERRIAAEHESTSDLAYQAALRALEDARVDAKDLDLILVATISPDCITPATACLLQSRLGAKRAAAFDLSAACSGFIYGLATAQAFIKSGTYQKILLVGAEKLSAFVDWQDRSTCVLFGDGAGATVIGESGHFLLGQVLGSRGDAAELLQIPGGGAKCPASAETVQAKLHTLRMQGRELFKIAVKEMTQAVQDVLARAGLSLEQVRWLIPHQANRRIIEAVAQKMEFPMDRVYVNLDKVGNTSSASIILALDEMKRKNLLRPGDVIVLVAFGAGLTVAAGALQW